jgi:hypothetical protein
MKKILFLLLICSRCFGQGAFLKVIVPVAVINVTGVNNTKWQGITIVGVTSRCIQLTNCSNDTIEFCRLINSTQEGVYLYNCSGIVIEYNFLANLKTGVNAVNCPSGAIVVNHNQGSNFLGPFPAGQFCQYNNVGGSGNSISYNIIQETAGQSTVEDNISIFESSGTSGSPLMVSTNWIRGGGPSHTGSGILIGDVTGSYESAINNVIVNSGNIGIGVAAGSNEVISGNQIYGAQSPISNVGFYILNLYSGCSLITASGNLVNWTNAGNISNGYYTDGSCGSVSGSGNNYTDGSITSSILGATILTYN